MFCVGPRGNTPLCIAPTERPFPFYVFAVATLQRAVKGLWLSGARVVGRRLWNAS